MNPMFLILGGVGLWWLLKKKEDEPEKSPTNVVNLPEVLITPGSSSNLEPRPSTIDNSPVVTSFENDILNGGTPTNVYNAGMSSSNRAFVTQAANQLAEAGDTRAMDLTLRLANWNS